jgi:hypothetical protein
MRTGTCVPVALAALLPGALAAANPISMEAFRAKQVPFTTHVQLSFGLDGKTPSAPTLATRDGSTINPSWTALASYKANTGSGLRALEAVQACDCNVAVGQHSYQIKAIGGYGGKEVTLSASITVVAGLGDPKDAGPLGDVHPWEIPEPGPVQGLDCKAKCAAAGDGPRKGDDRAPPDMGPAPDKSASSADRGSKPDTMASKPAAQDDGGCSLAGRAASASLAALALALCALGVLLRRRR